jgi:hypothetical protein
MAQLFRTKYSLAGIFLGSYNLTHSVVRLLEARGPHLGLPHSKYSHMRELRTQHQGRPYQTLYAFDPKRMAILLIGGD